MQLIHLAGVQLRVVRVHPSADHVNIARYENISTQTGHMVISICDGGVIGDRQAATGCVIAVTFAFNHL